MSDVLNLISIVIILLMVIYLIILSIMFNFLNISPSVCYFFSFPRFNIWFIYVILLTTLCIFLRFTLNSVPILWTICAIFLLDFNYSLPYLPLFFPERCFLYLFFFLFFSLQVFSFVAVEYVYNYFIFISVSIYFPTINNSSDGFLFSLTMP